jgi:hypothetical protein
MINDTRHNDTSIRGFGLSRRGGVVINFDGFSRAYVVKILGGGGSS